MTWHNAFCATARNQAQRARLVWVVLGVVMLLTGCTATRPTIKIGLLAPFEGVHRPLGYDVLYAVKLAVQERNAQGGVGGYGIELVALNDDGQAAHAERQVAALAADPGVVGVIGPWQTSTARAAGPAFARAGLPAVIAAALPDAGLLAAPGVFRLYAGDEVLGRTLATAVPSTAAWTIDGDTAGWPAALAQVLPPAGSGDQVVILTDGGESIARTLAGGLCQNSAVTCLAGPSAQEPVVPARAGAALTDLSWVSSLPVVDCGGQLAEFCASYRALAGRPPGPHAVLAYDATHLLLDAMDQAARTEAPQRQAVAAALAEGQRQGLVGKLTFDTTRSWAEAPAWLYHGAQDNLDR